MHKQRKIFIDGGAHHATSLKFFLNHYKDAESFETHSFEINSDFSHHFEKYVDNKKHFFYNQAIWVHDGHIEFYKMPKESSTIGPHSVRRPTAIASCINFSKWLKENFTQEDYIVLKLDIEGAEFSVLPQMFKDGSIEMIDKLYIEFHYKKRRNTNLELSLSILEKLIFKYQLDPMRWNATGKDSTIDKIDLDWRVCKELEKQKPNSDLGIRWKLIKEYFGFNKWYKGMPIYSPQMTSPYLDWSI